MRAAILHLGPPLVPDAPGAMTGDLQRLVQTGALQVEHCGDVYRGLARALRAGAGTIQAIVVCVDALGPAEMEVFERLQRPPVGAAVYVYSGVGLESVVADALRLGARNLSTVEELLRLNVPVESASMPAEVASAVVEPEPLAVVAVESPVDEEPPIEEEETEQPTRVPWLRYAGAPERGAPPPSPPTKSPPSVSQPVDPPASRSLEPLLTDEELEALLSDDIAPPVMAPWTQENRMERGRP